MYYRNNLKKVIIIFIDLIKRFFYFNKLITKKILNIVKKVKKSLIL